MFHGLIIITYISTSCSFHTPSPLRRAANHQTNNRKQWLTVYPIFESKFIKIIKFFELFKRREELKSAFKFLFISGQKHRVKRSGAWNFRTVSILFKESIGGRSVVDVPNSYFKLVVKIRTVLKYLGGLWISTRDLSRKKMHKDN